MALVGQITCDVCGKQKQSVNHWWLASVHDGFWVLPWNETLQIKEYKHYCGHECAVKAFSEYLSGGK